MNFLSDFGVQPILLLAQVVNFLILLFILRKFLYDPLLKVLAQRKQKIVDSLKNAEEIEKRLAQANEKADEIIAKATLEGQKFIDEASKEASQMIEDAKLASEKISEKMLEQAKAQIQMEKENMRWELQKDVSKLAMMIVEKVTGKVMNQRSQKQLIEKAVREFKS